MSDPKVQAIAKTLLENGIKNMVDTSLKAMGADFKKDPKKYYRASRQVFKAIVAAAAQRILEDGGNRKLLEDTYSAEDAWELFLELHPEIAAKIEPQAPPKLLLKLLEGGKPPDPPLPAPAKPVEAEWLPGECSHCHTITKMTKNAASEWVCNTCGKVRQPDAPLFSPIQGEAGPK